MSMNSATCAVPGMLWSQQETLKQSEGDSLLLHTAIITQKC